MTYKKAEVLAGRVDGSTPDVLRWHQVMKYVDLAKEEIVVSSGKKAAVFLEFAVDEGVRRNQGRMGAKDGSAAIAKALANFPLHLENTEIFHGGVITCDDENLEKTQAELADLVEKVLRAKALPIVLGGGHEVTYGHFLGIKNFLRNRESGICSPYLGGTSERVSGAIGVDESTSPYLGGTSERVSGAMGVDESTSPYLGGTSERVSGAMGVDESTSP